MQIMSLKGYVHVVLEPGEKCCVVADRVNAYLTTLRADGSANEPSTIYLAAHKGTE